MCRELLTLLLSDRLHAPVPPPETFQPDDAKMSQSSNKPPKSGNSGHGPAAEFGTVGLKTRWVLWWRAGGGMCLSAVNLSAGSHPWNVFTITAEGVAGSWPERDRCVFVCVRVCLIYLTVCEDWSIYKNGGVDFRGINMIKVAHFYYTYVCRLYYYFILIVFHSLFM